MRFKTQFEFSVWNFFLYLYEVLLIILNQPLQMSKTSLARLKLLILIFHRNNRKEFFHPTINICCQDSIFRWVLISTFLLWKASEAHEMASVPKKTVCYIYRKFETNKNISSFFWFHVLRMWILITNWNYYSKKCRELDLNHWILLGFCRKVGGFFDSHLFSWKKRNINKEKRSETWFHCTWMMMVMCYVRFISL